MGKAATVILLLETNLNRREHVYDLLTRHGYTVLTASSTEHALELLKHERPHVILGSFEISPTPAGTWIERIRAFDATTPIIVTETPHEQMYHPKTVQAILQHAALDEEYLAAIQRCRTTAPSTSRKHWPAHVVVVDDEPRLRQILVDFLTLRGFHVSQAACGDDVLVQLAHEVPNTVLLDISMPGMDGLLALKKIKALHPATHVIMMTGVEAEEALNQAMALGASDYITKPFDFEYLETVLLSKLVLGKAA